MVAISGAPDRPTTPSRPSNENNGSASDRTRGNTGNNTSGSGGNNTGVSSRSDDPTNHGDINTGGSSGSTTTTYVDYSTGRREEVTITTDTSNTTPAGSTGNNDYKDSWMVKYDMAIEAYNKAGLGIKEMSANQTRRYLNGEVSTSQLIQEEKVESQIEKALGLKDLTKANPEDIERLKELGLSTDSLNKAIQSLANKGTDLAAEKEKAAKEAQENMDQILADIKERQELGIELTEQEKALLNATPEDKQKIIAENANQSVKEQILQEACRQAVQNGETPSVEMLEQAGILPNQQGRNGWQNKSVEELRNIAIDALVRLNIVEPHIAQTLYSVPIIVDPESLPPGIGGQYRDGQVIIASNNILTIAHELTHAAVEAAYPGCGRQAWQGNEVAAFTAERRVMELYPDAPCESMVCQELSRTSPQSPTQIYMQVVQRFYSHYPKEAQGNCPSTQNIIRMIK